MSNLDYTTTTKKSQPADGSFDDYEPLGDSHTMYFKANTFFALTINPCDDLQFLKRTELSLREQRCRDAMLNLVQELNHHNRDCEIHILPELSELLYTNRRNAPPRFHWHGIIRWNTNESLKRFLLIDYVKLIDVSQVMIKQIDNKKGWYSYMTKAVGLMNSKAITNNIRTLTEYKDEFSEINISENAPAKGPIN